MEDLITWLRACLDDDEETAKAATPGPWKAINADEYGAEVHTADGRTAVACSREGGGVGLEDALHIARHDPAAVLEDVEAKRAVLDEYESAIRFYAENTSPMTPDVETRGLGTAITLLARAYRHRPGWRTEWE